MATKEDLLHEINIVTTFSSKYDMKDPSKVGKYLNFFKDKNAFKTQVGVQYLERLNQIQQGNTEELCFVCKKNRSYDGVLCSECMNKYSQGKKRFYGEDDLKDLSKLFENKFSETDDSKMDARTDKINNMADSVKTKAIDFTNKVQERLNEDDIQNVKEQIKSTTTNAVENAKQLARDSGLEGGAKVAKEKTRATGGKIISWWKARKKWQTIAIIAVLAFLVIGAIADDTAKTDIMSFIDMSSDEIFSVFDEKDFVDGEFPGITLVRYGNPGILLDVRENRVYSVEINNQDKGYDKYCVYDLEIGDSKDEIKEKISKIVVKDATSQGNNWFITLRNDYKIWIIFDDNDKASMISLDHW